MTKHRTSDTAYRRARARTIATETHCWICGQSVDKTLKAPHPMSPSADHVIPVARGGHNLGEMHLAHLGCNKARQTRNIEDVRPQWPTSEDW